MRKRAPTIEVESHDVWEYRSGRYCRTGDRLRIGAGPYWVTSTGDRHNLGDRGTYTFLRLIVVGGQRAAVCSGIAGATIVFPVSGGQGSPDVRSLPGYVARPYRFVRVKNRKRKDRRVR